MTPAQSAGLVAKWRKRPIVVEAIRLDGTEAAWQAAIDFMGSASGGFNESLPDTSPNRSWLYIDTPEGVMTAATGDWIIRGVAGEFYPCKPDIFAATYEPAALAAPAADGVPESEWRWHGLAAHFICAKDCLFHMATEVGEYMVSTVGDLRLHTDGERRGERQEIGCGRTYETFVFNTKGTRCDCGCGMPEIIPCEIDAEPANDPAAARENHMAMCAKYAAAPQAQGEGNG